MIGIFDSGLGGLSVYERLKGAYPQFDFIYLGDHANAPYGNRNPSEIHKLTLSGVDKLFHHGCTLVILACNTASVVALERLRDEWVWRNWPGREIFGVAEPTVREILQISRYPTSTRNFLPTVAVFATPITVQSGYFERNLMESGLARQVIEIPCRFLASVIESGANSNIIGRVVSYYVNEMKAMLNNSEPDIVVLGCTHYALVQDEFKRRFSPGTLFLSQPDLILKELDGYSPHAFSRAKHSDSYHKLFTTGDLFEVSSAATALLKRARVFRNLHDDPSPLDYSGIY